MAFVDSPRYRLRKWLVPKQEGCASMSVARFVPWGIQPEPAIRLHTLGKYLGVHPRSLKSLAKRMGIPVTWEPPAYRERRRSVRGKHYQVSEENAARLIVRVRCTEAAARQHRSRPEPERRPLD